MKKIIQYVLGKTIYAQELNKLEYKLTSKAFFSGMKDEQEFKDNLKLLEQTFDKLPAQLKLQRIPKINRYIDSTTDEPMLYSSYDATNTCYNIIVKTYLLNLFQKEKLDKTIKNKIISHVKENIYNHHLGDLGKTLDFLKIDSLLDEKPYKHKSQKI